MLGIDSPRGAVNGLWLWCFPAFDALPVAPAVGVPFLPARLRRPVSLLRLPARPSLRRFPALCAAISLARLPGMKALLASFQQTRAGSRPAGQWLPPPPRLVFGVACRALRRAHWRGVLR